MISALQHIPNSKHTKFTLLSKLGLGNIHLNFSLSSSNDGVGGGCFLILFIIDWIAELAS